MRSALRTYLCIAVITLIALNIVALVAIKIRFGEWMYLNEQYAQKRQA